MIGRYRNQVGQGTSEYIVVVALIGIAAIGVVSLFGENLRAIFAGAANALAGNTNERIKSQQAHQRHTRKKTLGDFMLDNGGGS
jgi:pilus assembly protein Flp/PilA